jgi:hypothetical protein
VVRTTQNGPKQQQSTCLKKPCAPRNPGRAPKLVADFLGRRFFEATFEKKTIVRKRGGPHGG